MLKVRMMLGYRLLKSNTQTLRCRPARGSSTWPPCCAACTRESSPRTLGATMPSLLEFRQVQKIERRDARGDAIRRHARQLAAREREPHQIRASATISIGEPRIRARIEREAPADRAGSCA